MRHTPPRAGAGNAKNRSTEDVLVEFNVLWAEYASKSVKHRQFVHNAGETLNTDDLAVYANKWNFLT